MVHLSSDTKEVIVQKVLLRDNNSTVKEIAVNHNIGYSTLQRWVKNYNDNTVRHHNQSIKLNTPQYFCHFLLKMPIEIHRLMQDTDNYNAIIYYF